jgi:hypothetical protein
VLVDDVLVLLALQLGLLLVGMLEIVEIFEEQNPGGLLGVVQLGGAAGLFPQDVVDVLEGLLEHGGDCSPRKYNFIWQDRRCHEVGSRA